MGTCFSASLVCNHHSARSSSCSPSTSAACWWPRQHPGGSCGASKPEPWKMRYSASFFPPTSRSFRAYQRALRASPRSVRRILSSHTGNFPPVFSGPLGHIPLINNHPETRVRNPFLERVGGPPSPGPLRSVATGYQVPASPAATCSPPLERERSGAVWCYWARQSRSPNVPSNVLLGTPFDPLPPSSFNRHVTVPLPALSSHVSGFFLFV